MKSRIRRVIKHYLPTIKVGQLRLAKRKRVQHSLAHSGFRDQNLGAQPSRMRGSPEWRNNRFQDSQPPRANIRKSIAEQFFGPRTPATQPEQPVAVVYSHGEAVSAPPSSGLRVTWFGHSSALIEVDGSRLLIDPFWSERASPISWAGPKRWYAPPIPLSDLPTIDAVLISHDHYDHLDFNTIAAMRLCRSNIIYSDVGGKWLDPRLPKRNGI